MQPSKLLEIDFRQFGFKLLSGPNGQTVVLQVYIECTGKRFQCINVFPAE